MLLATETVVYMTEGGQTHYTHIEKLLAAVPTEDRWLYHKETFRTKIWKELLAARLLRGAGCVCVCAADHKPCSAICC